MYIQFSIHLRNNKSKTWSPLFGTTPYSYQSSIFEQNGRYKMQKELIYEEKSFHEKSIAFRFVYFLFSMWKPDAFHRSGLTIFRRFDARIFFYVQVKLHIKPNDFGSPHYLKRPNLLDCFYLRCFFCCTGKIVLWAAANESRQSFKPFKVRTCGRNQFRCSQ